MLTVLSAPAGPHDGPINLAIRDVLFNAIDAYSRVVSSSAAKALLCRMNGFLPLLRISTRYALSISKINESANIRLCFLNTLRLRHNGCHFTDDTFKVFFPYEYWCILIPISLRFVPTGSIDNNPALVQIMAWCRPDDKPLPETMMVNLLTQICSTRPQWVNLSSATCATCIYCCVEINPIWLLMFVNV